MANNIDCAAAAQCGLAVNDNGGTYERGRAHGIKKKIEVQRVHQSLQDTSESGRPNLTEVARVCRVDRKFVVKVERELDCCGQVLHPRKIHQKRMHGPGVNTIDSLDAFVLLILHLDEPSRSLSNCPENLCNLTGAVVSNAAISRFWNHAFPISGKLHKPNLIPCDKFKPDNILRAREFTMVVAEVDPWRVKCGDEKLLKGSEVHCRRTRRNAPTGEVPPSFTSSDFCNTCPIISFCGIDTRTHPVHCRIHNEPNDAEQFAMEIEHAVHRGFLRGGDILVLDNAACHVHGENAVLEEWLWTECGTFVLFLPTRTPEWNPAELVWRQLVTQLKCHPIRRLRSHTKHSTACAAHDVLSQIAHDQVFRMHRACGCVS